MNKQLFVIALLAAILVTGFSIAQGSAVAQIADDKPDKPIKDKPVKDKPDKPIKPLKVKPAKPV
jgi:hypothetical protein